MYSDFGDGFNKMQEALASRNKNLFIKLAAELYEWARGDYNNFYSYTNFFEEMIKNNEREWISELIITKGYYIDKEVFVNMLERRLVDFKKRLNIVSSESLTIEEGIDDLLDLAYWVYDGIRFAPSEMPKECLDYNTIIDFVDRFMYLPDITINFKLKHIPNRIYTEDIFIYANNLVYESGLKFKDASERTLAAFNIPIEKKDSFERSLRNYNKSIRRSSEKRK